ncbi:MAG: hypothetical protein WBM99_00940 [Psychromonas sp.]
MFSAYFIYGESDITLVLISTSMILISYFSVDAYLFKVTIQINASLKIKGCCLGAGVYGIWLVYAAGLNSLLLSTLLYLPGLAVLFYSKKRDQKQLNEASA